ncbi:MAG TPA: superoxide dismutase family protein [Haloplasmataceae bacterium]
MEFQFIPKGAFAILKGSPKYPNIYGEVFFEEIPEGVMVNVYVEGLPNYTPGNPPIGPHGFHIHEFGDCTGNENEPFMNAGKHYNPNNQPHGNHAGDLPSLFSNNGVAYMTFFTNKFTIDEIIGKAVIIHENPDDYRTEPSGNSGMSIACGVIQLSEERIY